MVLERIYVKGYCIMKHAKSPVTPGTISLLVACSHTYHSRVRRHALPIAICGWVFDNGDFRYVFGWQEKAKDLGRRDN